MRTTKTNNELKTENQKAEKRMLHDENTMPVSRNAKIAQRGEERMFSPI